MTNKKNKKIRPLLITILLMTFLNLTSIHASEDGEAFIQSDATYEVSNDDDDGGGTGGGGNSCIVESCQKGIDFKPWSKVYIKMKDIHGNEIPDASIKQSKIQNNFLAGTYVNLKVYESKGYTSTAWYKYSAFQKVYTCTDNEWDSCKYWYDSAFDDDEEPECHGGYKVVGSYTTTTCSCDAEDTISGNFTLEPITGNPSSCSAGVATKSMPLTASYKAIYRDVNDIKSSTPSGTITPSACSDSGVTIKNDGDKTTYTRSGSCNFEYNMGKTCIDVKTGKVSYGNNCAQNDEVHKMELKSEDGYWKYFIPLNANSLNDFSFSLTSSDNKQEEMLCKNIIETDDNYANKIVDINGNPFSKITNEMNEHEKKTIRNAAIKIVTMNPDDPQDGGCFYASTITIPIEQKFYNEQNNNSKSFKGFNFYYKPIDVNNPFPNGINNTSIWYDWSKSDTKNPNLDKSYNTTTYYTDNLNTNTIRTYNSQNLYNDWSKMNIDGTSQFIDDYAFMHRKENLFTYKLGCGPANKNEYLDEARTKKNPLYQKECGNS